MVKDNKFKPIKIITGSKPSSVEITSPPNKNFLNETQFVFASICSDDAKTFFLPDYPIILVGEATYNVIKNSNPELLSIFYFDKNVNRKPLVLTLVGSEKK